MTTRRLKIIFVSALFFVLIGTVSSGRAEQQAITNSRDLNCTTTNPAAASVTNLETGHGIGKFSLDSKSDVVPPCSGNLPTNPPFATEFALPAPIPLLAKITSSLGECSGNFIAQNAVITAGHCVVDLNTKQFARNIQIIGGYQNGQNTFNQSFVGESVLTFEGYTSEKSAAHDIAVIRFQASLLYIYGYYGLSSYNVGHCADFAAQKDYTEPHYSPNIGNNQTQAGADGQTSGCVQGTVVTTLPLLPGSSGSAVIDRFSRAIFAVHSQYSLSPPGSYDAVLTHAKICTIYEFVAGRNEGGPFDCAEGH